LARDAGEAAYVDGSGRIEVKHATAAIQQLGLSYARGLSTKQRQMLEAVAHGGGFDPADPEMMFLLASRRVVEYSSTSFAVHPALVTALELDAF
jgi:hypothetical protein